MRKVKIIDTNPHEGEVMPFEELLLDLLVFLRERRGSLYVHDLWTLGTTLVAHSLHRSVENDPDIPRDGQRVTWSENINEDTAIAISMPVPEYTGVGPDLTEDDVAGDVAAAKALWQERIGIRERAQNPGDLDVMTWLSSVRDVKIEVIDIPDVIRKEVKLTWRPDENTPPCHVHGDGVMEAIAKAMVKK